MGDPLGLSQAGLAALEFLPRPDLRGDVAHDSLETPVGEERRAYLNGDNHAVLAPHPPFAADGRARVDLGHPQGRSDQVGGVDHIRKSQAQEVVARIAQQRAGPCVDLDKATRGVREKDAVRGLLDQGAIVALAGPQRLLHLAALRHVAPVHDKPLDGRIIQMVARHGLLPAPRPIGVLDTERIQDGRAAVTGLDVCLRLCVRHVIGVHETKDAAAHQVRGRIARQALMRGAGVTYDALRIDDPYKVAGVLGEGAKSRLAQA